MNRRVPCPRLLILAWCFWLLVNWLAVLGMGGGLRAARVLVFACMIGMSLLWPMLRLSQHTAAGRTGRGPGAWRLLLDWFCLVLVLQATIWPLRLVAGWHVSQVAWLVAAIGAWGLLAGAVAAVGQRSRHGYIRAWAMVACVLLLVGEPLLMGLLNTGTAEARVAWPMRVSPIQAMWAMSTPDANWSPGPWATQIVGVFAVATVSWVLILALKRIQRARG